MLAGLVRTRHHRMDAPWLDVYAINPTWSEVRAVQALYLFLRALAVIELLKIPSTILAQHMQHDGEPTSHFHSL